MDILAAQLHSMVKEAPIDECRKALKNMTMSQAVDNLKKRYSKEFKRKQNIEELKNYFNKKSLDVITKVLDESNNDFNTAFGILLTIPDPFEVNKKQKIVSSTKKIVHMKKKSSSESLSNSKETNKLTPNATFRKNPSLNTSLNKAKANNQSQSNIPRPDSLNVYHDPIVVENTSKKISGSSMLPRMEIPSNKIESNWNTQNKSNVHNISSNTNNAKQEITGYKYTFVDDKSSDNDEIILSDYDNYYNDYEEEEEYDEYDNEYDSTQESQGLLCKDIDLHGKKWKEAKFIVENQIIHANENRIGVFRFISGMGNHSADKLPQLRPLVLEVCKRLNVRAYVPSKNPGVVMCNVCKPWSDQ